MKAIFLNHYKKRHVSAVRRIGFSFFMVILIGSFLLSLPIAHTKDIPYLDHLFTATSATCVTGLVTSVVKDEYTLFGQVVIISMIQIGGLGFLTLLSLFIVKFKKRLSYKNKMVMQEALNQNTLSDISVFIQRVIRYTCFFEGIGALFLSIVFIPEFGVAKGIYYSIFHSISAFCNAGFDILGDSSLISYQSSIIINIVIPGLIIAGGLGFIVWIELKDKLLLIIKKKVNLKKCIKTLSLHSKIVISMSLFLIFSGMFIFYLLEMNNPQTIGQLSLFDKLQVSYFQSVTLRTAGFASVNMAALNDVTKFFIAIYMFVGGSPAGTAGGIKTVTFAIILLSVYSLIKGREEVSVFKRKISSIVVRRALIISVISLFISITALFILSISEDALFIDLLFEVFSAFGTVGLSTSLTPVLSQIGKVVIIVLMYIGRIGPITMILIFANRYNQLKGKEIEYPQGDVLIG